MQKTIGWTIVLTDSAGINPKQSQQQRFWNINRNQTSATKPKAMAAGFYSESFWLWYRNASNTDAMNKEKSNGRHCQQTAAPTQPQQNNPRGFRWANSSNEQAFKRVRVDFRGPYISLNFHLAKLAISKKDPFRIPVPADWFGWFFTPNGCWHQNQKITTNFFLNKISFDRL